MREEDAVTHFRSMNKAYGIVFLLLILLLLFSSIMVSNYGALLLHDPALFANLKAAAFALTAVFLVIAYAYPQKQIRKMSKESTTLTGKIREYRKAILNRLVLIVAAGFTTCLFFLLTADNNLILVLAIIIIFLILARPTPFKTAADLKLNDQEKNTLMK